MQLIFVMQLKALRTRVLFYIIGTSYSTNFEYLMSLSLVQDLGSPNQTTHIPTWLNSGRGREIHGISDSGMKKIKQCFTGETNLCDEPQNNVFKCMKSIELQQKPILKYKYQYYL